MQILFLDFLQTPSFVALSTGLLFFLIALLLVMRGYIRFLTSVLILSSGLVISLVINYYQAFQTGFHQTSFSVDSPLENQEKFSQQMQQAIQDLWAEMRAEKKQLGEVMHQLQEVLDSMQAEKIKLQNFIEETHERFQNQVPPSPDPNASPPKT